MCLLTLASCATTDSTPTHKPLTFSEKKNCSPKSYEFITKRDEAREKKITLYEHNQLQNRTVDFFLEKEKDLLNCSTTHNNHVCIAISINSKSKVDYVEASDMINNLDPLLKSCIENKLKSYNYKDLQVKLGTKFIIPLKFIAQ